MNSPKNKHILFCFGSPKNLAYLESIVTEAIDRGHRVTLHFYHLNHPEDPVSAQALEKFQQKYPGVVVEQAFELDLDDPSVAVPILARESRAVRVYLKRLQAGEVTRFYVERWIINCLKISGKLKKKHMWPWIPFHLMLKILLHSPEHFIFHPLMTSVWMGRWLKSHDECVDIPDHMQKGLMEREVDLIVASPCNRRYPFEEEYIKAGKRLGIKTAIPVLTWDNPTTKGLFAVKPDALLVWNDAHREACRRIHEIDDGEMVKMGAPFFDRWSKDGGEKGKWEALKAELKLDPSRPFLFYLGSSLNIATDESSMVRDISQALDRYDELRDMKILFRPHPYHDSENVEKVSRIDKVSLWPSVIPGDPDDLACYKEALRDSLAVFGINTTAMIDAVINDKVCYSVQSAQFKDMQMQTEHFRQLAESQAVEVSDSVQQFVQSLRDLLVETRDISKVERKAFVRQYIRPYGVELSAGRICLNVLEQLMSGIEPEEIQASLDQESELQPVS